MFKVNGSYTNFVGFEMMSSDPSSRITALSGSDPADIRRGSLQDYGNYNKFINLVLHDMDMGIGMWSQGTGGEVYGSIIYNNGWIGPDRPHGHGIYAQNQNGTKRIADNIIFNQFDYGFHAYGTSKAYLNNFLLEGNTIFNSGGAKGVGYRRQPDILIGGGTSAQNITLRGNRTYQNGFNGVVYLGDTAVNKNLTLQDNYFVSDLALRGGWTSVNATGNTIVGKSQRILELDVPTGTSPSSYSWNNNHYTSTGATRPFNYEGRLEDLEPVEGGHRAGLQQRLFEQPAHRRRCVRRTQRVRSRTRQHHRLQLGPQPDGEHRSLLGPDRRRDLRDPQRDGSLRHARPQRRLRRQADQPADQSHGRAASHRLHQLHARRHGDRLRRLRRDQHLDGHGRGSPTGPQLGHGRRHARRPIDDGHRDARPVGHAHPHQRRPTTMEPRRPRSFSNSKALSTTAAASSSHAATGQKLASTTSTTDSRSADSGLASRIRGVLDRLYDRIDTPAERQVIADQIESHFAEVKATVFQAIDAAIVDLQDNTTDLKADLRGLFDKLDDLRPLLARPV